MGTQLRQRADGGIELVEDSTSSKVFAAGGGYKAVKVAKVALKGVTATTGGALFAWANPEGQSIIITRFQIDITTKSTGAANVSFGTAANATTSSDNLIDTYAAGGTEKVVDNMVDKGTNGKLTQKMTSSQYLTGTGSASTAGLVGSVYIHYVIA